MKKYSLQDGITQSLLGDWKMCPRRFQYKSELWADDEKLMRAFGTFGHFLLERWYRDPLVKIQDVIDKYKFPKEITAEDGEYCRAYAGVIIPFYMKRYIADFKMGAVTPEILIDTKFHEYRIRGKIDCTFEKKHVILLETKFKGQIPEESITNFLPIDWQTLFYTHSYALQFGRIPAKVIYNVIRFSQRSMKDGIVAFQKKLLGDVTKRPEYFFMRWETTYTSEDMHLFSSELTETLLDLQRNIDNGTFPRNLCACMAPYACAFINFCATGKTIGLKKKRILFTELEIDENNLK